MCIAGKFPKVDWTTAWLNRSRKPSTARTGKHTGGIDILLIIHWLLVDCFIIYKLINSLLALDLLDRLHQIEICWLNNWFISRTSSEKVVFKEYQGKDHNQECFSWWILHYRYLIYILIDLIVFDCLKILVSINCFEYQLPERPVSIWENCWHCINIVAFPKTSFTIY